MAAEEVWLPSVFCGDGVRWIPVDTTNVEARLAVQGHEVAKRVAVDPAGRLTSVSLQRWGNPDGGAFRLRDFGGLAEEERTFGGYTIPTRLRVGWYFVSPEFESKGEFFRFTMDGARFR